jgi:serine protease Do
MVRSIFGAVLAAGLALPVAALGGTPVKTPSASPPARQAPFSVQAEPEEAPAPNAAPGESAPPPILPAPDMPGDDPVVELPPADQPSAATPGLPSPGGAIASFADLAEGLVDSVVYISTSQRVTISRRTPPPTPQAPQTPTPPSDEFFEDFFDNEGEGGGGGADPRTVQSLGAGFVIDESGFIVTNNHVITDADEIVANFTDGTKRTAEVVGIDDKTDLALLKVTADTPLRAARFGRSERLRVGDWVLAIGNPFGFGGTVTAGIVSALDRDINSGPYDHYIQTDASINRGNSGGPLFNTGGEVVGVNTAIMSPTGGSIGIGFAVPSKTVQAVVNQLQQFGEIRRGWLGVKIQQVTDEIAESLSLKPARGALVAGIDDKGPAKPAGIETGDVIVKFDGKDIKEMRDLPRIVADTPVGKEVEVLIVRKGKEEKKIVKLGRLEDSEKPKPASVTTSPPEEKSVVQKTLGLQLSGMTDTLRKQYKIKDSVKGVVVTGVEASSVAADKRLVAGSVIVAIEQEQVSAPADVQRRVDSLKKAGKKTALLLVATAEGDMLFVALPIN